MQPFDVTPSAPHNMAKGPITVTDMSHADLGQAMPGVTATGGVLARFFYTRVKLKTQNAEHNGKWETRLCVAKQPKSDRDTVATSEISVEDAKRYFPREYDHFVRNEDAPTTGTPISELPGITMSQIGLLTLSGLRSIEDVAELDHDQAREIGFDAIRAHKQAKLWLERSEAEGSSIALADVQARYEQEIDARKKTETALQDRLKEMEIKLSALSSMPQDRSARQADVGQMNAGRPAMVESDETFADDIEDPLTSGSGSVELDDPLNIG